MRILITGGAGYIGYSLVSELIKSSEIEEIIIYDNLLRQNLNIFFDTAFSSSRISFIEGDILDNRKLSKACKNIDTIVHLAAKVTAPNATDEFHMFDYVNNWGTSNVVEQANVNNVSRFIYLSSLSVYGNQISVDKQPTPTSDYARSKYNGERHLTVLDSDCKTYIVRSGNTFGFNPCIRLDTVINKFAFRAKYNQKLLINGNGDQTRSFISITRLSKQLKFLVHNEYDNTTVNLADYTVSVNQIVSQLKSINQDVEFAYIDVEHISPSMSITDTIIPLGQDVNFKSELVNFYSKFCI